MSYLHSPHSFSILVSAGFLLRLTSNHGPYHRGIQPFNNIVNSHQTVIFIDAERYFHEEAQLEWGHILNALVKAYAGFNGYVKLCNQIGIIDPALSTIHTGAWGCGMFLGDEKLKMALQSIAIMALPVNKVIYHVYHRDPKQLQTSQNSINQGFTRFIQAIKKVNFNPIVVFQALRILDNLKDQWTSTRFDMLEKVTDIIEKGNALSDNAIVLFIR